MYFRIVGVLCAVPEGAPVDSDGDMVYTSKEEVQAFLDVLRSTAEGGIFSFLLSCSRRGCSGNHASAVIVTVVVVVVWWSW